MTSAVNDNNPMDFLALVTQRLEQTANEVRELREHVNLLDNKIKTEISIMGKRPRNTDVELSAMIQDLEYKHAHSSHNNEAERKFMHDIAQAKKDRKAYAEYANHQNVVDALKAERTSLLEVLKQKNQNYTDLKTGVSKLRAAKKSNCSAADITEAFIPCPEERRGAVVGKNGANFAKLENEFHVELDIDRQAGNIRIIGTPANIAAASTSILNTIATISEEITLKETQIVTLLLDKAQLLSQWQSVYNVRIDLSKAKLLCKISGHLEAINAVKAEIAALHCYRKEVQVDDSALGAIIGRSGATIRQIGENGHVQIDIDRETNKIAVTGLKENVESVATYLTQLFQDNREIEEKRQIPRSTMMAAIVGPNGTLIRELQRTLEVRLDWTKSDKEANAPRNEMEELVIKGTTAKVALAQAHITSLIVNYMSQMTILNVPSSLTPLIIGKGGNVLKGIRTEFPDAQVEVGTDGTITIHSANYNSREGARLAIERIVDANYSETLPFNNSAMIALKGVRGTECRASLATLGLYTDMNATSETVTLRGETNAVHSGLQLLKTFLTANECVQWKLPSYDVMALSQGGSADSDSLRKQIETQYGVDIYINSKEEHVLIRGTTEQIKAAQAAISNVFSGQVSNSIIFDVTTNFPFAALIGKAGANLKKFETDFPGVHIDMLKETNQIRVRGVSAEQCQAAKVSVLSFIDNLRYSTTLDIHSFRGLNIPMTDKFIETIAVLYQNADVELKREEEKVILRGNISLVESVRHLFTEFSNNAFTGSISIPPMFVIANVSKVNERLSSIGTNTSCKLTLNAKNNKIVITSSTLQAIENAKSSVRDMMAHHAPATYAAITLSSKKLMYHFMKMTVQANLEKTGVVYTCDQNRGLLDVSVNSSSSFSNSGKVEHPSLIHAKALITSILTEWSTCNLDVPVPGHMFAALVGKNGQVINALQKESGANVQANKKDLVFEVSATTAAAAQGCKLALLAKIDELKEQFWVTAVDSEYIGSLIGKSGAMKAKIVTDSGATSVDIDARSNTVTVQGTPEAVKKARDIIETHINDEKERNFILHLVVPATAYSQLIGPKGATARSIQEAHEIRLDIDRSRGLVILKGKPAQVEAAKEMIVSTLTTNASFNAEEIRLATAEEIKPPAPVKREVPVSVQTTEPTETTEESSKPTTMSGATSMIGKLPPGATPEMLTKMAEAAMSKSALKRHRQKLAREQAEIEAAEKAAYEKEQADRLAKLRITTPIQAPVPVLAVPTPIPTPVLVPVVVQKAPTAPVAPPTAPAVSKTAPVVSKTAPVVSKTAPAISSDTSTEELLAILKKTTTSNVPQAVPAPVPAPVLTEADIDAQFVVSGKKAQNKKTAVSAPVVVSTAAPVPNAAPAVASAPIVAPVVAPVVTSVAAPAPRVSVANKVTVAKGLVKTGLAAEHIAMAVAAFPYEGTQAMFIQELVSATGCTQAFALEIAIACNVPLTVQPATIVPTKAPAAVTTPHIANTSSVSKPVVKSSVSTFTPVPAPAPVTKLSNVVDTNSSTDDLLSILSALSDPTNPRKGLPLVRQVTATTPFVPSVNATPSSQQAPTPAKAAATPVRTAVQTPGNSKVVVSAASPVPAAAQSTPSASATKRTWGNPNATNVGLPPGLGF